MKANALTFACLATAAVRADAGQALRFDKHKVDLLWSEACAFGDFDGDGKDDIASGANWYAYPDWKVHTLRANNDQDDFMEAADVDGDGKTDVLVGAIGDGYWLRNPGAAPGPWPKMGSFNVGACHSGGFWDVDGDGKARELVGAGANQPTVWAEFVGGKWVPHEISKTNHDWGSGVGDINGDGRPDIIRPDAWYEAPADARNGKWIPHEIAIGAIEELPGSGQLPWHFDHPVWEWSNPTGTFGHTVQIFATDIDGDGRNDLIASSGHRMGIMWYRQVRTNGAIAFEANILDGSISEVHALELRDLDKDGDSDLVAGKRWRGHPAFDDPLSEDPLFVYWYERIPARPYFKRHTLSVGENIGAGTKIAIADYDRDGDLDLAVSAKNEEGRGGGPWLFENRYPLTREEPEANGTAIAFAKHKIDAQAALTCTFADIDRDGKPDLLAGDAWFRAPGWDRHAYRKAGGDGMLETLDADGDGWTDVLLGGYSGGLRWLHNPGAGVAVAPEWAVQAIDTAGNYENGDLWDVDGDGKAREAVSASFLPSVKWWECVNGKWIGHEISTLACNFGAGVGDVNGDGRPDIIRPNAWFEAPADPRAGAWKAHEIALGAIDDRGPASMQAPKWFGSNSKGLHGHTAQIRVCDVNRDGRNDIIAASAHRVGIFWYEQKAPDVFTRHTIDATWSQAHALEFRDLDRDGDSDLVAGKAWHAQTGDPQPENPSLLVWYEQVAGAAEPWIRHEISYGEDIGAGYDIAIADYDGDGDLDLGTTGQRGGTWIFENLTKTATGLRPGKASGSGADAGKWFRVPGGRDLDGRTRK